jgi:hypothetical protein
MQQVKTNLECHRLHTTRSHLPTYRRSITHITSVSLRTQAGKVHTTMDQCPLHLLRRPPLPNLAPQPSPHTMLLPGEDSSVRSTGSDDCGVSEGGRCVMRSAPSALRSWSSSDCVQHILISFIVFILFLELHQSDSAHQHPCKQCSANLQCCGSNPHTP